MHQGAVLAIGGVEDIQKDSRVEKSMLVFRYDVPDLQLRWCYWWLRRWHCRK